MQNKLLKIARMGLALVILSFGALPAMAQDCEGWSVRLTDEETAEILKTNDKITAKIADAWELADGDTDKYNKELEALSLEELEANAENTRRAASQSVWDSLVGLANYWREITPEQVQTCLKEEVNINVRIENGQTPLHNAARFNKNPEVIMTLLKAGANLHARDTNGLTPFHLATGANTNPEVTMTFLKAGADVNVRDKDGWTPFHIASGFNTNPEVIAIFLKLGVDLSVGDKHGNLPLHLAARWNANPEIIMVLLKSGADGKIKNQDEKTAFDLANENKAIKDTEAYWALNEVQY